MTTVEPAGRYGVADRAEPDGYAGAVPSVAAVPSVPSRRTPLEVAEAAAALLPALREGATWAGAMLRRLGDAARRPGPDGGWTPVRIVLHLAAVDVEVWTPRLAQLAAHEHPTWAWTEPSLAAVEDPSPDAAAALLTESRARLLDVVAGFDDAALACTGVHATFGELDVAGLLGEVVRHDAEHLASLAEAVAARSGIDAAEVPGG